MPLTLAKIAANTATVTLAVGEDTATIVYFPGRVTEKAIAVLNSFSSMDETNLQAGFRAFNAELVKLIQSWDVLEDDGTMFPLDADRLSELPVTFRVQVLSAILGDIRPNQAATQTSQQN